MAQVQKVSHARVAALAGVDVIAAQGTEAGGHTGYSGTLPLVPAVIDVVGGIPVVAAGALLMVAVWQPCSCLALKVRGWGTFCRQS